MYGLANNTIVSTLDNTHTFALSLILGPFRTSSVPSVYTTAFQEIDSKPLYLSQSPNNLVPVNFFY